MQRRGGGKKPEAAEQLVEDEETLAPNTAHGGRIRQAQAKDEEEKHLAGSDWRAAAPASTREVQAKEEDLGGPMAAYGRTSHAKPREGATDYETSPLAGASCGCAPHTDYETSPLAGASCGCAPHAAATRGQEQPQRQQHGQPHPEPVFKRHRHNPTHRWAPSSAYPEEDTQAGPLALLPEDVLHDMMSLLAAEEGGSRVRSACRWLRSAFDRCNTRLVLRGTGQELPDSFPARLLGLVRCSPCVSSLTLAGGMRCVTWPQVLKAGGPQLPQRLERLTLMQRPYGLTLEALAACTRLQQLRLHGYQPRQLPALQLHPLAACGGTLRHLEIQSCSSVRDFTPLAACAALQHLTLGACHHLADLAPLAACARLQQLRLSSSLQLQDLSPLTACEQLQTLHVTFCWEVTGLAAFDALQELNLGKCSRISDPALAPLASCGALQRLDLRSLDMLQDLGPLSACAELRKLNLSCCIQLSDLAPLASCVALQHLDLGQCNLVLDLEPLASCAVLQHLNLEGCCRIVDLGPLAACIDLRQLFLNGICNIHDLGPLAACVALHTLDLGSCDKVDDLGPLASCVGLRVLRVSGCTALEELGPLAACIALQELNLEGCERVVDLGPLATCVVLKALVLEGCGKVQSLSPLAACLGLERLDLRGCGAGGRSSLAALPRLHINAILLCDPVCTS